MPTDGYVQVQPDSTGDQVDCVSFGGSPKVVRQRVAICDGTNQTGPNTLAISAAGAASVSFAASATGGASKAKLRNVGSVVSIKASSGTLFSVQILNTGLLVAFVQIFDLATGSVTLGTTTPDKEIMVQPQDSAIVSFGGPSGIAFATAISIASTTLEGGSVTSAAGVMAFADFQ